MIEEDVSRLQERVDTIETKFANLVKALNAGFGDEQAMALSISESRNASLAQQVESMRVALNENNSVFVELARAMGIRGNITRDALLRAVKRRHTLAKGGK